jgi:hypothetical protein
MHKKVLDRYSPLGVTCLNGVVLPKMAPSTPAERKRKRERERATPLQVGDEVLCVRAPSTPTDGVAIRKVGTLGADFGSVSQRSSRGPND